MELTVNRDPSTPNSTSSLVLLDNKFETYGLEDTVRETLRPQTDNFLQLAAWVASWKIAKQTAIPSGRYRLVIDRSDRFSRIESKKAGKPVDVLMPHVLDVPGFDGIRIHPANWATQLEGCLAPGDTRGIDAVLHSKQAFERLMVKLHAAEARKEAMWITYNNPPKEAA